MARDMPMGACQILRDALKIPSRNGKLFLSIALLLLIPSSLIFLAKDFAIEPFIMGLWGRSFMLAFDPRYTEFILEIKRDAGILLGKKTFFLVVCSIVSLFTTMATIYASAVVYHGKDLTSYELFLRIGRTWMQPMITWLYITLFNSGYLLLILILTGLFMTIARYSVLLAYPVIALTISLLQLYVYFAVVWKLGIVVSVIEESNYGMRALAKAEELIERNWKAAFLLYALSKLVELATFWILSSEMEDMHRAQTTRRVIGLALVNATSLENIFTSMAFTVFYVECKKSHGEKVETEGETGNSLVPTIPLVELSLP